MMFYGQCWKCGQRWELGTAPTCTCPSDEDDIGQVLKRAIERINELEAELLEQARVNGMGGEREASLMAELERKSDAIQRLWKERDELRSECRTLVRQNGEWQELTAELVEALRCADAMLSGANMDAKAVERKVAAALAKVGASK